MAMVMAMYSNGVDGNEWKHARNGGGNGKGNMTEAGKHQQHLAAALLIAKQQH